MEQTIQVRLKNTFDELHGMISSLNNEQLNKVPFEGSWTAAQVADHLYKSYNALQTLNGKTEPTSRPVDEKVQGLEDLFLNFDIKMKSPSFILPSEQPIDKETLLNELKQRTDDLVAFAATNDLSPTCLDAAFPGEGHMTRFEWLSFINVHTERHNHQLKNIIRDVK